MVDVLVISEAPPMSKRRLSSRIANISLPVAVGLVAVGLAQAQSTPTESDLVGRWILAEPHCATDPDGASCASQQIVEIRREGDRLVGVLERPSRGLAGVGVRAGRRMFTLQLPSGGTLHSVYPPHRTCGPHPHLAGDNPIVGVTVESAGGVRRLVLDYDYLPYDHARCGLHTDRPDRRRNVYHALGR